MSKVKFIFCVHNHQPVGNFEWVFEKAYQVSYKPFMETMLKHPKIKWSMHASGMIWEYVAKEHPEYIENIKRLVASGNLEILSGGYYEPIMPSIPDSDKAAQINKLSGYVKGKFDCKEATGAWLAERVWEPSLAKILSESGIKYTVLDDAHFSAAGMDADNLFGYYTTEDQGSILNIFPISQRLRYSIPFRDVSETINYFKDLSQRNLPAAPIVVMADDGEKFGMWPGTYKHVYENGWLENFLTALEANSDIVETVSFSDVLKTSKSSGRIYLPCASYFEMSEWSLPASAQGKFDAVLARYGQDLEAKTFLRGGFWRNFLTKYEEANNMNKKMLFVSAKVSEYAKSKKPLSDKAADALYAGQCNCAYWHGVFGGLYLPHLRKAVYSKFLQAESFYNKYLLKRPKWTAFDFNCDANNEYIYESKTHNIYVSPAAGGTIFEWDIFKSNHNFGDTLTRRYEPYHKKLKDNINNAVLANDDEEQVQTIHNDAVKVKEAGLDRYLAYDDYTRASLADHFFDANINHNDFMFSAYRKRGDFAGGNYEAFLNGSKLSLERKGTAYGQPVSVKKVINPEQNGYSVEWTVANESEEELHMCFAPEFVFAFVSKTGEDTADLKGIDLWKRYDDFLQTEVSVRFSDKFDAFVCPIETVSLSENGYEKTYQGTSLAVLVRKALKPKESLKFSIAVAADCKKED